MPCHNAINPFSNVDLTKYTSTPMATAGLLMGTLNHATPGLMPCPHGKALPTADITKNQS
jgi:hypothetical protein